MAYIALYRKWRPQSFKDLVGQEHISRTLSNAITSGRIGHAYLFSGPRGTGKTSTAKILAMALNCEHGPTPDPCGKCASCRKIIDGSSMDVFEIDAASNRGIDEIRDLRETVKYAPVDGRYKVYIIDEVHMLTAEAFNALLKTLEEPPEHVVFILATTEAHKVPATIQSRCQRYDFKRITVDEIKERMRYIVDQMGMEAEDEALTMIAIQADGGLRDALSILDQCSALEEGKVTAARVRQVLGLVGHEWIYDITKELAAQHSQAVLQIVADLLRDGKDLKQILAELSLHLRSIMIYQATGTLAGLDLYDEQEAILQEQSKLFAGDQIMQMIQRLHEAMNEMKWSPQPRITVEVALLALCHPEESVQGQMGQAMTSSAAPQALSREDARIAALEAKIAKLTAAVASGQVTAPKQVQANAPVQQSVAQTMPQAQPAQKRATTAAESEVPANASGTVDAQGIQLWQQLLQTLRERGKEPVLACVGQGQFAGMTDGQFFVRFHGTLMASLTMRNYRKMIESILQELSGRELRLQCSGEDAPLKPPPRPKKQVAPPKPKLTIDDDGLLPGEPPPVPVDLNDVPPEDQDFLANATNFFGDNIVGVEEDGPKNS